jgi:hypothetical protein
VRPVSGSAVRSPEAGLDVLADAEALGIPWQSILESEILAERVLRDSVENLNEEWPLACLFSLLPNSLLQSWRARERIHALSWEARAERSRAAANRLRSVFLHLAGKRAPGTPFDFLLANHLGFAYERVLQLQRISKTAEKSKGNRAERIEAVVGRTHCSHADAGWAVDRAGSWRRSHRLDDAMRRARQEGFELPVANSELTAFARLKRFVQRRPFLRARRKLPPASSRAAAAPESPSRAPQRWIPSLRMTAVFPEVEQPGKQKQGSMAASRETTP